MEEEINSNGIVITKNIVKIGSRKVFLHSGEVHYFRVPPEQWEDRLTKAKALGLNAISTYVFWNFHEKEPGRFDITSINKDLDHFLHLCENKGFYIIIRPGPWIGSDLVNGGIPQWLLDEHPKIMSLNEKYETAPWKSKKAPPISYLSPTYLRIVEKYIQNLSDVLRRHLYPHGGLILLQIDNEMSFGSNLEIFDVDYNPVSLEFYKKFLKGKYRDIERINQLYSQNFLSFDHVDPPTSKTNEEAINSQNDFKSRGEFLRNLDWMEFRERILQEYVATISYFWRKNGLFLPYFVNVPFIESPVNIKEYYQSYKTKILVGLDINDGLLQNFELTCQNLESKIEILKSQMPLFSFIPELKIGTPDKVIPPNNVHLLVRQLLGNGVKGFNHYMGVGGITPTIDPSKSSTSVLNKSIGYDEESFKIDDTGTSYDYCAPIGMNGQKNPNYEVVELVSKYIRANEERLLSAEKVYDDDIVILSYHPYTRMKFDSSKFGFITDFQQVLQNYPYSEFSIFSNL
ncbi:MAG: beta-galactosidase, partial [Promethearchaeota archaeon]